ncbi:Peroxisomal sarcosine oxidase [Colletotrichum gloeosporioides]|uniref:Peroxisomal sarcosine oxidase n=1 Tax=Colletotrichum gloeosporioides TaxID=474922 RepID=A0A8H4CKG1_COLGL|nr:Peroxisomal sarcosine oxidase [Colletotrichum gloeosporioides]KAF3805494.1 Peroxisomal sarcosine oxidase [Colletotrichum gloeosporioides]
MSATEDLWINNGDLSCTDGDTLPDSDKATIDNMEKAGHRDTQLVNNSPQDLEAAMSRGFLPMMQPFSKNLLGVLDTTGGITLADKACRFALHKAKRLGVRLILDSTAGKVASLIKGQESDIIGVRTTDGKSHKAALTIIASGGWTPTLVPSLDGLAETTAGSVVMLSVPEYLRGRFAPARFPAWSYKIGDGAEGGLYGFPVDENGVLKIGYRGTKYTNPRLQLDGLERSVPVTRWTEDETIRQIPTQALEVIRRFINEFLPELSGIDVLATRLCWYTDSFDNHFVIDRVPQKKGLMVATAGSGHAFKYLPTIGNWVVDIIEGIIMYDPGVGSSDIYVYRFTGGLLGTGLAQNIREVYNFICANYVDGDDIILIGFSRVGLLTPLGLDRFYAVFEDYESMTDVNRNLTLFLDPQVLPYDGEKGNAKREWEKKRKLQYEEWLKRIGVLQSSAIEMVAYTNRMATLDTNTKMISDHVENAFHALALDEDLKQMWFPGSHSTVGGGWHEQQIANISLAWMCDQLSSVGIEFNPGRMEDIFNQDLRYSAGHRFSYVTQGSWVSWLSAKKLLQWAQPEICAAKICSVKRDAAECNGKDSHPAGSEEDLWKLARPWGLGLMRDPGGRLQTIGGTTVRHPGIFMRTDPDTNQDGDEALLNTNERIHSSVRVRLACQGLALDDAEIWDCKPLTRAADGSALWKLERGSGLTASELNQTNKSFRPRELDLGTGEFDGKLYPGGDRDGQWRWVLVDKRRGAVSLEKVLPEEPVTGYWERYLLALTAGKPDVCRWAEENPPLDVAGSKA